ncbi:ferritin-like domain-containing protein [Longivirga aurantiaca]|uniref:Bacterioferritin n=1 Tax=Longivirga aurantiaca TaxID=1837743 RepID=A0ABW1T3N4_9ACTN
MLAPDRGVTPLRPAEDFIRDVEALRTQARENLDRGAVSAAYGADLERVVQMLQTALATELVCVLRYRQHHYAATGMDAEPIAAEFLAHSEEELGHAGLIAARISQLGSNPDFSPSTLEGRAHSEYVEADSLRAMVTENLVAERVAVAAYTDIIEWLGSSDPTTRRMLEQILAVEEEHADDLASMLDGLPAATGPA